MKIAVRAPRLRIAGAAAASAISVPGSLLTAAAPDGDTAAELAATVKYNWAFSDLAYASISGNQTATPLSEYSVTLTTAERTAWDDAVAEFAAPAVTTSALEIGGVAAGSFALGLAVWSGSTRLLGFKDSDACAQRQSKALAITDFREPDWSPSTRRASQVPQSRIH